MPHAQPKRHQATRHGNQERHRGGQDDILQQGRASVQAVRGGNAYAILLQCIAAPVHTLYGPCAVSGAGKAEVGRAVVRARKYASLQQAYLAGDAVLGKQIDNASRRSRRGQ